MTDLVIVPGDVHLVRATESEILCRPHGELGTAGMYYRQNTTTGYLEKGKATTAAELGTVGGILIEDAEAGKAVTIALPGAIVDLGDALTSLAYGASVYVSDTDATLADAAGTVSRRIGTVIGIFGATTGDKVLLVQQA